ncbi:uncharacterized protein LOC144008048 isoform X2 [Festucalex cinctus]
MYLVDAKSARKAKVVGSSLNFGCQQLRTTTPISLPSFTLEHPATSPATQHARWTPCLEHHLQGVILIAETPTGPTWTGRCTACRVKENAGPNLNEHDFDLHRRSHVVNQALHHHLVDNSKKNISLKRRPSHPDLLCRARYA